MIEYQQEPQLSADEFIDVLIRSTLAQRRPVDEHDRIAKMLQRADIVLTARHEGALRRRCAGDQRLQLLHLSF